MWDDPGVHQLRGRELVQGPGRPAGDVTRHARQCDQIQIDVQEHHLSSLHKTVHFIEAEEAGSKKHLTCMNILKLISILRSAEGQSAQACMTFFSGKFCNREHSTCFSLFEFFRSDTGEDVSPCLKGASGQKLYSSKKYVRSRQDAKGWLLARFFFFFMLKGRVKKNK